jgi:histidinol-phosphate aminotransferase
MSYFRSNVDRMAAYVPGEQPPPGSTVIKLNTNENPYPPSPRAMAAMRELDGEWLRRYPHPYARQFREAAATVLDVPAEWIIPGNGSDDLLAMIVMACAEPGRKVVYPMPTYVLYRTLTEIQDAQCVEVPFDDDYSLPVEALVAERGAVTFVATPNSPSGTVAPADRLADLARRLRGVGVLVIDEAYADFAEENAMHLVREFDNVIILRTFSKGYSLAGLRLGFGVMQPSLGDGINKVRDSYPVSAVGCVVGAAAMLDQDYKNECIRKVKAARQRLTADLRELGWRVWPSQANFVLAGTPGGAPARGVYEALKSRGILVRYFNQPGLTDKLRITVGTQQQNEELVRGLRGEL